jgi:membrane-associated phospholipid phosphatase
MAVPSTLSAQTLEGENARDIARVTTPTISQVNNLRNLMTTDFVLALRPEIKIKANNPKDQILLWHTLALNVTAVDHTSELDQNGRQIHLEQYGPHRAAYALARVHLAMFEVANAYSVKKRYKSWLNKLAPNAVQPPPADSIESAAIIEAAYISLLKLYPNMGPQLKAQRDRALGELSGDKTRVESGRAYGETVANALAKARTGDNADMKEVSWGNGFLPLKPAAPDGTYPAGQWQIDPVSGISVALGANWNKVRPFGLNSSDQFRSILDTPPPPELKNDKYRDAYVDVFKTGGDERHYVKRVDTANKDQYFRAKFWAYDATAGLCAPARLYNQISDRVLEDYLKEISPSSLTADTVSAAAETARYYALINLAMADAAIAAWDGKYHFQYWRPVTGIRYEQAKAASSGNPDLEHLKLAHEPVWFPLGAQTTNSQAGYNITPPFPAYPSGHAVFGGALFKVLMKLVPHDRGFSFQSDEFNGKNSVGTNVDAYNYIRCKTGDDNKVYCKPLHFASFKEAEEDNANSRVWMGVHWKFDAEFGNKLGEAVGVWAYDNTLQAE